MAQSVFVAEGWFQGRMYHISDYPGVIASEDASDRIYGELYKLSDAEVMLKLLDDYEECAAHHAQPAEYTRIATVIKGVSGRVYEPVWIYLYQWSIEDKAQIQKGDFMRSLSG